MRNLFGVRSKAGIINKTPKIENLVIGGNDAKKNKTTKNKVLVTKQ